MQTNTVYKTRSLSTIFRHRKAKIIFVYSFYVIFSQILVYFIICKLYHLGLKNHQNYRIVIKINDIFFPMNRTIHNWDLIHQLRTWISHQSNDMSSNKFILILFYWISASLQQNIRSGCILIWHSCGKPIKSRGIVRCSDIDDLAQKLCPTSESFFGEDFVIYIYIYIYTCVCARILDLISW